MKNSEYLKNTRGKNYLYHELLSLEQNKLSLQEQKEILLDLANKYLAKIKSKFISIKAKIMKKKERK